MNASRLCVLALCAWVGATSAASGQGEADPDTSADLRTCLDSGDDICLVNIMLDYAAQGRSDASFLADLLDGGVIRMLLRRCRPMNDTALASLQEFLLTNERTAGWADDDELPTSVDFNRAVNSWLANPQEPFEPVGDLDVFGVMPDGVMDERQVSRMVDLSEIILVEGACGSPDRERRAIFELARELDVLQPSLSIRDQIETVSLKLQLQERLDDQAETASLTQELTALIPQLPDPTFGTTILMLEMIRDHDLDLDTIAVHWNNPLVSAIAAQSALERSDASADDGQ